MAERKTETGNGAPTPRQSLNIGVPEVLENSEHGVLQRVAKFTKRLNEVMSGMYTGVGCSGTPHSHHSYKEKKQADSTTD